MQSAVFFVLCLFTIQNIAVYYPIYNECFIHMYISQSFTSGIIHTYMVARPFTCGTVCLPLFLKVIEKGSIIRAVQVAVGYHTENILLYLYHYTIVPLFFIVRIYNMHSGVFRCWNQPSDNTTHWYWCNQEQQHHGNQDGDSNKDDMRLYCNYTRSSTTSCWYCILSACSYR